MACSKQSPCVLCSIPSIWNIIRQCELCHKRRKANWQYAAINSYKLNLGVPIVSSYNNLLLTPYNDVACVSSISPLSTFMSIFWKLEHAGHVIHFGKPHGTSYPELIRITDALRTEPDSYNTIAVDFNDSTPHEIYSNTTLGASPYNSVIHEVITDIIGEKDTVCWYWNHDSAYTAVQFQGSVQGLWFSYNGCTLSRSTRLSGHSASVLGIPLHSDPLSGDTVAFNTGIPELDVSSTVNGELSSIVKSVASEYLNCVMKDNRCFSCSVISQLHSSVLSGTRHDMAHIARATLTDAFARCLQL